MSHVVLRPIRISWLRRAAGEHFEGATMVDRHDSVFMTDVKIVMWDRLLEDAQLALCSPLTRQDESPHQVSPAELHSQRDRGKAR